MQLAYVLPEGPTPPANCSDLGEVSTEPEFQSCPLMNAGAAAEKVTEFFLLHFGPFVLMRSDRLEVPKDGLHAQKSRL